METKYLYSIILSAFLHALYNYMMRRSEGSRNFVIGMFAASSVIAIGCSLAVNAYSETSFDHVPMIYGASFFYMLYQMSVSKAYETGEISKIYPLTVLSPILIPFWALITLGERTPPLASLGILIAIAGAIAIKLKKISIFEIKRVFQFAADYKPARYALASSGFYSVAATLDKAAIGSYLVVPYLSLLLSFMTINMIFFRLFEKRSLGTNLLPETVSYDNRVMFLTGAVVFLSFLTFRISLKEVYVSIAVPVRLVSIIFAMGFGIFFLKEKVRTQQIAGALLIITGITLIQAGAK